MLSGAGKFSHVRNRVQMCFQSNVMDTKKCIAKSKVIFFHLQN